jgi:hypothetical protein
MARDRLTIRLQPAPDEDAEELAELARRLRSELLELDVDAVDPVVDEGVPEQTKGLGAVAGWLAVRFGTVEGLRAVLTVLGGWTARTNRSVEVSYGSDVLKVTAVTSQQQEQIIDAWLARHAPSA